MNHLHFGLGARLRHHSADGSRQARALPSAAPRQSNAVAKRFAWTIVVLAAGASGLIAAAALLVYG